VPRYKLLTEAGFIRQTAADEAEAMAKRALDVPSIVASAYGQEPEKRYEWLGAAAWNRQLELNAALADRADDTVAALDAWAREFDVPYDVAYIPKGHLGSVLSDEDCCSAMRTTLRDSADYEIIYDGAGATIARRLRP